MSPPSIDDSLQAELKKFCSDNNLVSLYRSYVWGNDFWDTGFIDILRLERQLASHHKKNGVSLDDVKDIARWGKLRNPSKIKGNSFVLPCETFYGPDESHNPQNSIHSLSPLSILTENITSGIGPTYFSKILRFAAPRFYGAIDTRCVRVFGKGDPACEHHDWLDIYVKNYGYGWFIPEKQKNWPNGYVKWLDILKTICSLLPANCPHPSEFVKHGLREKGVWTCADVEMVLFTYASMKLR